jgi:hypothetical protein
MIPQERLGIAVRSRAGRTVVIPLDGACPCGKSPRFGSCCAATGQFQLRPEATTKPPKPVRGYSHPRCYAKALGDCDSKISKEHYFSKGAIQAFNRGSPTWVEGPGLPAGRLPPDQVLQSKILCIRHNSALSRLDDAAIVLTRGIREGMVLVPRIPCLALRGYDLERWLLKVACGFRVVLGGQEWVQMLFGDLDICPPIGLRMRIPLGKSLRAPHGIQFVMYRDEQGPSGAEVSIHGVRLTLDLRGRDRTKRPGDKDAIPVYRPIGLWFDHSGRTTFLLSFHWEGRGASDDSLVFETDQVCAECAR